MNYLLGVVSPWRLIVLRVIQGGIFVGIAAIFSSKAKHKSRAETLSTVLDSYLKKEELDTIDDEYFAKLERLNKLKQDGALTLKEQKQPLVELLEKNQLYVNLSSRNDKGFSVSLEEKKRTQDFTN